MERVDLVQQFGIHRQRRWRQGGAQSSTTTAVAVGQLSDGRWYAERIGRGADVDDRQRGACVFNADDQGKTLAERLAQRWMSDGEWRPAPAAFDAHGKPTDGLPWVKRGGDWFLEPDVRV